MGSLLSTMLPYRLSDVGASEGNRSGWSSVSCASISSMCLACLSFLCRRGTATRDVPRRMVGGTISGIRRGYVKPEEAFDPSSVPYQERILPFGPTCSCILARVSGSGVTNWTSGSCLRGFTVILKTFN